MKERHNKTLLTDFYQLTMNAAYFDCQKNEPATFELFIRKLPEDWGFYIVAGIEDVIDYATNIKFTEESIVYLKHQNLFKEEFLQFLRDFKFEGDIYAIREGTPIAPNTPILSITAKRTQAQFLESALLNIINFQTMIATKANRIINSAKGANIVEFGLRRAQEEDASIKGARATYIAGAVATSNVKAGELYGIPISGTQAHSFVMSFPTELEAFRTYTKAFPNNATLLIDTYETIQGAKNATIVGKELEKQSNRLKAVRLDSGDLLKLSIEVRKILNEAGLNYVKIFASNDLNEYKIDYLISNGAKIDAFGVGTEMITAKPVAAIPGVYKLVEDVNGAKIKLSPEKKTYPGRKQIYRQGSNGTYLYDILALEKEKVMGIPLLELVIKDGKRVSKERSLHEIRQYCLDCVSKMPEHVKQIKVKEPYELRISPGLADLVEELTAQYRTKTEGKQNENIF